MTASTFLPTGKSNIPWSWPYHISKKIYKCLKIHRKIMRRPSFSSWFASLNGLANQVAERDNCSLQEARDYIDKVISFHLDHIRDRFQPKLYSAMSICEEFHRIEDAIERFEIDKEKKVEPYYPRDYYPAGDRRNGLLKVTEYGMEYVRKGKYFKRVDKMDGPDYELMAEGYMNEIAK